MNKFIIFLLQSTHKLLHQLGHDGDFRVDNHTQLLRCGAGDYTDKGRLCVRHTKCRRTHSQDSPFDRNISKSTRANSCSSGLPIADRASMVSSASKRFSSIGLLYTVVFFMITSFGTAKIQNYIKLSSEIYDYQFVNF